MVRKNIGLSPSYKPIKIGPMMDLYDIYMLPASERNNWKNTKADMVGLKPELYETFYIVSYSDTSGESEARIRYIPLGKEGYAFLTCEFCSSSGKKIGWCPHIATIYHAELDSGVYTPSLYFIPVSPADGVFCPFKVVEKPSQLNWGVTQEKLLEISMSVQRIHNPQNLNKAVIDTFTLGYGLLPKLNTIELRKMAIDFFSGFMDNDDYFLQPPCLDCGTDDLSFTSRFNLAMSGYCSNCYQNNKDARQKVTFSPEDDAPMF